MLWGALRGTYAPRRLRYELLLQSKEPGAPWDPAAVEKLFAERTTLTNSMGERLWRLKHGDVEIRPLVEGGKPIATELRAPLSDRLDLIRELVLEGVALADAAGARLVDPQLGKSLTTNDEGLVADSYLRTAQYAGQYAGVSEAVVASYGQAEPVGLKPGTKVALVVIGVVIAVFLLLDALL